MLPWIGPGPDDRDLDDDVVKFPRASAAAASTSAPGSRSGRRRSCRPRRSCRRPSRSSSCISGEARVSRCPLCSASRSKARRMQPSMPTPSTSTFMIFSSSRSSFSHSITRRSTIVAGSIGTRSSSRSRVRTKPPGCWREMARRADQLAGQLERQREPRIVLVEAELLDMAFGDAVVRPAPDLAGQGRRSRPPKGPAPCRPRAPRRACGSG